jgi:AcrR family transcriptional regulator
MRRQRTDTQRARQREEGRAALLEAARRRYLDGQPIDIPTLAAEQGISRATAYRWIGGNDDLLAAVLYKRTDDLWARYLDKHRDKTGAARIVEVISDFLHHVDDSKRFHTILETDPQRAMSIVASSAHPNQQLMITLVENLLRHEADNEYLQIDWNPHTLAYTIVRIFEAFLYADIVAGEHQDLDRAIEIIDILVRSTPNTRHTPPDDTTTS